MAEFDRLPAPLRLWLHTARLPWSPRSAARLWARALAEGRDPVERLADVEAARLARERRAAGPVKGDFRA